MSLITAFNNQMSNFMNDLSYLYPNDKKFIIFEQKFEILRKANPALMIKKYFQYIYQFKESIMSKDEEFFKDKIKPNNLKNVYNDDQDLNNNKYIPLKEVLNLTEYWDNMNDVNKEAVWKYFKVLTLLSEKWALANLNK